MKLSLFTSVPEDTTGGGAGIGVISSPKAYDASITAAVAVKANDFMRVSPLANLNPTFPKCRRLASKVA
jgi:hypothetical protein